MDASQQPVGPGRQTDLPSRRTVAANPVFWVYLLLITASELLTFLVSPQFGLILHTTILVGMLVYSVHVQDTAEQNFAKALALGPLARILSLGLPLQQIPQIWWYPLVTVPLLCSTWVIIQQTRISWRELRLQPGRWSWELMLTAGGLGLGALEYAILRPAPLVSSLTWESVLVSGLITAGSLIFRQVVRIRVRSRHGRDTHHHHRTSG